jgi:DNA invertase Pin-like site-specific DNA recombinase
MLFGYARVSTQDQNPALQLDALTAARCEWVFEENLGMDLFRKSLSGSR